MDLRRLGRRPFQLPLCGRYITSPSKVQAVTVHKVQAVQSPSTWHGNLSFRTSIFICISHHLSGFQTPNYLGENHESQSIDPLGISSSKNERGDLRTTTEPHVERRPEWHGRRRPPRYLLPLLLRHCKTMPLSRSLSLFTFFCPTPNFKQNCFMINFTGKKHRHGKEKCARISPVSP